MLFDRFWRQESDGARKNALRIIVVEKKPKNLFIQWKIESCVEGASFAINWNQELESSFDLLLNEDIKFQNDSLKQHRGLCVSIVLRLKPIQDEKKQMGGPTRRFR